MEGTPACFYRETVCFPIFSNFYDFCKLTVDAQTRTNNQTLDVLVEFRLHHHWRSIGGQTEKVVERAGKRQSSTETLTGVVGIDFQERTK